MEFAALSAHDVEYRLPREEILHLTEHRGIQTSTRDEEVGDRPRRATALADEIPQLVPRQVARSDQLRPERAALALLSGRRHRVLSAATLVDMQGQAHHRLSTSILTFKRLGADEITAYIQSDEWRGKAGGYAIQGRAEAFVRHLAGSHSGVMGLPLYETRALLLAAGAALG